MNSKNNKNHRAGLSFGITSAIITTLGVILALGTATKSVGVVLVGILVIAISDSLADALAVHISQESENQHTSMQVWQTTRATFFSKIIISSMFIIPFLFFPSIEYAIYMSIVLGLTMLSYLSYRIARSNKENWKKVVFEHNLIAILVIVISYCLGELVNVSMF